MINYYCGPDWLPDWLRPKLFNDACKVHDEAYESAEVARKYIDIEFLNEMLVIAGDNPMYIAYAIPLFVIVRVLGRMYYGE